MSIARELSCDVAAAILAGREGRRPEPAAGRLTDVILEVHTTLRQLTREARRARLNSQFFPASDGAQPDAGTKAASGGL